MGRWILPALMLLIAPVAGALAAFLALRPDPPVLAPALPTEGAAEYLQAGCPQCHLLTAYGDPLAPGAEPVLGARSLGPDLSGIGLLYPDGWHTAHFWQPDLVVGGSQMPAQRQLFEPGTRALNAQGRKVVAFLQALTEPGASRQPWPQGWTGASARGDAVRGGLLFARHCAGCHGAEGAGDGPAAAFLDGLKPANLKAGEVKRKRGASASREDLFTILTNGVPGTGMPSFHALPVQDRADLAEHVYGLAH